MRTAIGAMLLSVFAFASGASGQVLFTENWDAGPPINPANWSNSDAADIILEDPHSTGDWALALKGSQDGGDPQWGDHIYSVHGFDRGGLLVITYTVWIKPNINSQVGIHGGWHWNTAGPIYNTIEAAIDYVVSDLRATERPDGLQGGPSIPNFTAALTATNDKSNALLVRITLGNSLGAKWEWSGDNGDIWNVERNTLGQAERSSDITNYIGFGPFGGSNAGTAMIDDIVVSRRIYELEETDGDTAVSEDGSTTDTYTFAFVGTPNHDIVLTIDPNDELQVNAAGQDTPVELTFTPADANQPQTITVMAWDDPDVEGLHLGAIGHTTLSADANYSGLDIDDLIVTITDDDVVGVTIDESDGSTDLQEGTTGLLFTEDWSSGITTAWANSDSIDIVVEDAGGGDLALALKGTAEGGDPVWGDHIYSTPTWPRATGGLIVTYRVWYKAGTNTQCGIHGGWHNANTGQIWQTHEADVDYVYSLYRAGESGEFQSGPVMSNFTADWPAANTKNGALLVRITLDAVRGAKWEYSKDNGTTWTVERNTLGSGTGTNVNNYLGFGPFTAQAGTTYIDDISVYGAVPPDTYTVVLDGKPSSNVIITADPDNQLELNSGGQGATVNLTFIPVEWDQPQTVTVLAWDDADSEGPHTGTIIHSSSGPAEWTGLTIDDVVANITDDEHYCGEPFQFYLEADVAGPDGVGDDYRDCHVNLYDFAVLAAQWLDCTNLFIAGCHW